MPPHKPFLPTDVPDDEARRLALKVLLGVGAATYGLGCAGVAGWYATSLPHQRPTIVPAGTPLATSTDVPLGGAIVRALGRRMVVILRRPDGSLAAFDAACTHLGCQVVFRREDDRLVCGCHGAMFHPDTGDPLAGPAPTGLLRIAVVERDGAIVTEQALG